MSLRLVGLIVCLHKTVSDLGGQKNNEYVTSRFETAAVTANKNRNPTNDVGLLPTVSSRHSDLDSDPNDIEFI